MQLRKAALTSRHAAGALLPAASVTWYWTAKPKGADGGVATLVSTFAAPSARMLAVRFTVAPNSFTSVAVAPKGSGPTERARVAL